MSEYNVRFLPQDRTVRVRKGTDLLTAAVKAGIVLNATCGGDGICGKCRVVINRKEALACQTIVESDISVKIPEGSLGLHEKSATGPEEFTKGVVLKREGAFGKSPLVRKVYLEMAQPTGDDATSDLERVCNKIADISGGIAVWAKVANVRHIAQTLRESGFKVTAVLGYTDNGVEILAIEPGDTTAENLGFAFDIGTTTVAGQLLDINSGRILGSRISFNKQANYGSDVITRIIYASEPDGLEKLGAAVLGNINEMIEDLLAESKAGLSGVYSVMCAGNMTMMHLLLRIDPSNIRKPPYVPATAVFPTTHAAEIGMETNPKAIAAFAPGVSTYIGGDIVAGVLATGLADGEDLSLLIDIGTNGEIVLGNREWMMGTAASAGPAFEGSGLSCGMKAVRGAINKVSIDSAGAVRAETIGGARPKGICGSGYIDLLCRLLERKVIGRDGRIGGRFVVCPAKGSDTGRDIVIDNDDIENLKRSKGAIYSAITALLNKVGKDISEVKRVYIAGGFGNYLNIENSVRIGLLPDIKRDVYEFVGNSSLAGARMSLLSHDAFLRSEAIAKNITYLDLSSEPGYMDEYIASLFFPHTDIGRFPSVRL